MDLDSHDLSLAANVGQYFDPATTWDRNVLELFHMMDYRQFARPCARPSFACCPSLEQESADPSRRARALRLILGRRDRARPPGKSSRQPIFRPFLEHSLTHESAHNSPPRHQHPAKRYHAIEAPNRPLKTGGNFLALPISR